MNTPHIGITYTQRNGLRHYRKAQRKTDRIARVQPQRRHDDTEPTWPECIAMVVIALAAWALFGWGVVEAVAWWLA